MDTLNPFKATEDGKAESLLKEQKQKEQLRLDEEESLIAEKKARASKGLLGRGSLIKTSETGMAKKLSGEM